MGKLAKYAVAGITVLRLYFTVLLNKMPGHVRLRLGKFLRKHFPIRAHQKRLILSSGLWDQEWVQNQQPQWANRKNAAIQTYLRNPGQCKFDPNPLFDTQYYLDNNQDIVHLNFHPFIHYLKAGHLEGRKPNPLFNDIWYRATHKIPKDQLALAHYLSEGERAGMRPHPLFEPAWYRKAYLQHSAVNALGHYLRIGEARGLQPNPDFDPKEYLENLHENRPQCLLEHYSNVRTDIPQYTDPRLNVYNDDNQTRVSELHHVQNWPTDISHKRKGLCVLILNKDRPEFIIPILAQLELAAHAFAQRGLGFNVLIGDTGSRDPSVLSAYQTLSNGMHCHRVGDYNFSRNNNSLLNFDIAVDTVLFLNNDIEFSHPELSLLQLFDALWASDHVGIVGANLRFPNGQFQHTGITRIPQGPLAGFVGHCEVAGEPVMGDARNVLAVTGALLMVRFADLVKAGAFDEGFEKECQDVDLCLRLRRMGKSVQVVATDRIIHFENGTRPKNDECWADRRKLLRRWRHDINEWNG